jgi:hypothetical protein
MAESEDRDPCIINLKLKFPWRRVWVGHGATENLVTNSGSQITTFPPQRMHMWQWGNSWRIDTKQWGNHGDGVFCGPCSVYIGRPAREVRVWQRVCHWWSDKTRSQSLARGCGHGDLQWGVLLEKFVSCIIVSSQQRHEQRRTLLGSMAR